MLIIVRCTPGPSLRRRIGDDEAHLSKNHLTLIREKKMGRAHGWSKVKSNNGAAGAINFDWSAQERTLTCRVVTRGGKPHEVMADFTRYLLARYSSRIQTLTVFPK